MKKSYIIVLALAAIIGAIFYFERQKPERNNAITAEIMPSPAQKNEEKAKRYPRAKEITTPDGFVNTEKISISELIGKKVILIDFWTYSCINCQRTTPYLNAWYKKYKGKGFEIIGIHTPEFEFEKKYENVKAAVKKFGITFPVVLDNDYSTWNAYQNRYWPRKYLIDIDGFIVYDHIGEGAYEETEKKIQELLGERMATLEMSELIETTISRLEGITDADVSLPRSPEIYFGASRNTYLGNGATNAAGTQTLSEPHGIKTNILYLAGTWNFQDEFAENISGGAKIIFRYQGKNVYFVAGSENGVKVKIMKDGKLIGEETVREHILYHIIKDTAHGEHTLELIIEDPGLRAYTFTFG